MKVSWKWILLLAIAISGIVFFIVPQKNELIVKVRLPSERVMMEFEDSTRLMKWYTPAQSKEYSVSLQKPNPFTFVLLHEKNGSATYIQWRG